MSVDSHRAIPEEEMTAVDLRRQIRDVAQRIGRLAADRRALEEARADLAAEGDEIGQEIAIVEREQADLAGKLERERSRLEEIDVEIERLEQEIPILERRRQDQTGRSEELARESEEVEDELFSLRREFSDSERTLETLKESLSRLDHRLHRVGED